MLIEAAGCKAFKVGKAEVSPYHSNFLYNKGASAEDILSLSLKIRNKVFEEFGVWLQYEMEILGNIPENFVDQITEQRPEQYKKEKLQKLREAFKQRKPITV